MSEIPLFDFDTDKVFEYAGAIKNIEKRIEYLRQVRFRKIQDSPLSDLYCGKRRLVDAIDDETNFLLRLLTAKQTEVVK